MEFHQFATSTTKPIVRSLLHSTRKTTGQGRNAMDMEGRKDVLGLGPEGAVDGGPRLLDLSRNGKGRGREEEELWMGSVVEEGNGLTEIEEEEPNGKYDEDEIEFRGRDPSLSSLLSLVPGVEDEEGGGGEPAPASIFSQLVYCSSVIFPFPSHPLSHSPFSDSQLCCHQRAMKNRSRNTTLMVFLPIPSHLSLFVYLYPFASLTLKVSIYTTSIFIGALGYVFYPNMGVTYQDFQNRFIPQSLSRILSIYSVLWW